MTTLLILNHMHAPYFNQRDPEDMALYQEMITFSEHARDHVDAVMVAIDIEKGTMNKLPETIEEARTQDLPQYGDVEIANNGGRGEPEFLREVMKTGADKVIIVGYDTEACVASTALSIKKNLSVDVVIPSD